MARRGYRIAAGAALLIALGSPALSAAQVAGDADAPVPAASPSIVPDAVPIPAAPVIVLPTPAITPGPTPSTTPRVPVSRPTPSPTPTSRPATVERATPSPTPTASAVPAPSPAATTPTSPSGPVPIRTQPPVLIGPPIAGTGDGGAGRYWLTALVAVIVVVAALAWVLLRRRRADAVEPVAAAVTVEEAPPPGRGGAPRARLTLGFRPIRAGVNLLSATSENEIVLANVGDVAAEEVRVVVRLLSAHGEQDADLAAFYAEPIGRPAVAPFVLQPGESRTMNAVAALPRDAIRSLTAAGRPLFVPVVAVNVTYRTGETTGQLAQAFAVGVERIDSAKLAPFWLDAPPRTFDQVAARAHAAALER